MPGKACERYIFHVMAYANFFEMPKIRTLSDSLCFLFELSSRALFLKCPIFICSIFLKCPIFESEWIENRAFQNNRTEWIENWAFQNNRTYENRAFQKKSTWWEFEQKRERNWNSSNFGYFKKICICHHVKNISFTYFSGHFMIPPVYYLSYIILFQHNFRSPAKLTQLLWILKCKVGFKPTKIKFYPSFLPW